MLTRSRLRLLGVNFSQINIRVTDLNYRQNFVSARYLNPCPAEPGYAFANSVDPNQLASEEAN